MSLHTKYRPSTFDEVLGQDAVVRSLKATLASKRAKAFLFVGPAGTGKTTLARLVASAVSGGAPSNLYEYDAVSNSGKDKAKELVSKLYFKAIGESPVKFVIIDECHRLSADAWDVFLKPVEEPPEHVYYAFCTTILGKIPKAILTRCQRYNLHPVKEEILLGLLVSVCDAEKLDVPDEILELIAEEANGSPRLGLVHLETCLGVGNVSDARRLVAASGQNKEVVDFCRWVIGTQAVTWAEGIKYIKALEGEEPEGIRIVLCNYIAAVLLKTTNDGKVKHLLRILEAFKTPYNSTDKLAPLLYSLGMALNMDA